MARVFISYRRDEPDRTVAEYLHRYLSDLGHDVFLDTRRLRFGQFWHAGIQKSLAQCDYFVALISLSALYRPYIVEKELNVAQELLAADRLKRFLPVSLGLADDAEFPESLADLRELQFFKWRKSDDTAALAQALSRELPHPINLVKGLSAYDLTDSESFAEMGRQEEIEQFVKLVRGDGAFFLLHGQSGVGKTSFLRAGVAARLDKPPVIHSLDAASPEELEKALEAAEDVIGLDQFERLLVDLSRTGDDSDRIQEALLKATDAAGKRLVFALRDEYRTAFETLLPKIGRLCQPFALLALKPATAALVMRKLLENMQVESDDAFLEDLCREIAQGVPPTVLPAILQLIAQHCQGRRAERLDKPTWQDLTSGSGGLFEKHIQESVLDRLPANVTRLQACRVFNALSAGEIRSSPREVESLAVDTGLSEERVAASLNQGLLPSSRVIREETAIELDRRRYALTHDLFAQATDSLFRREMRLDRERRARQVRIAISVLLALALGALGFAVYKELEASRNAQRFLSRDLSGRSEELLNAEPARQQLAGLLAVEALGRHRDDRSEAAVRDFVAESFVFVRVVDEGRPPELLESYPPTPAICPDGRHVSYFADNGEWRVFDRESGERVRSFLMPEPQRVTPIFTSNDRLLALSGLEKEFWAWNWMHEEKPERRPSQVAGISATVDPLGRFAFFLSPFGPASYPANPLAGRGRAAYAGGADSLEALFLDEGRVEDLEIPGLMSFDWHPDGLLAASLNTGTVVFFRWRNDRFERVKQTLQGDSGALQVRFAGDLLLVRTRPTEKKSGLLKAWKLNRSFQDFPRALWEIEFRGSSRPQGDLTRSSPDGSYLAWRFEGDGGQYEDDGEVWVIKADSGSVVFRLDDIGPVEFSHDSRYLAAHTRRGDLKLHRLPEGSVFKTLAPGPLLESSAVSPADSAVIAGDAAGSLVEWKFESGFVPSTLANVGAVADLASTTDGEMRAMAWKGGKKSLELIGLDGSTPKLANRHDAEIVAQKLACDGKTLATKALDGSILVSSEGQTVKLGLPIRYRKTDFSNGDRLLQLQVSEEKGTRGVPTGRWERQSKGKTHTLLVAPEFEDNVPWRRFTVTDLLSFDRFEMSPDGSLLAVFAFDLVWIYDVEKKAFRKHLSHDGAGVKDVCFSNDGNRLLTLSSEEIRLWDLSAEEKFSILHHAMPGADAPFPEGESREENATRLMNLGAFSRLNSDGAHVAAYKDDQWSLQRIADGRWLFPIPSPFETRFSRSGRLLAVVKAQASLRQPEMAIFDSQLFDIRQERTVGEYPGAALAFSFDESLLLTKAAPDTVQLWRISNGERLSQIRFRGPVKKALLTRDNKHVVALLEDGSLEAALWRTEDLIAEACRRFMRPLTKEEWDLYLPGESRRPTCPGLE